MHDILDAFRIKIIKWKTKYPSDAIGVALYGILLYNTAKNDRMTIIHTPAQAAQHLYTLGCILTSSSVSN